LEAFEERINDVINEDITYAKSPLALRNQRCYAVRVGKENLISVLNVIKKKIKYLIYYYQAGFNGLLDVARQTYKETVDDLNEMIDQYRGKCNIYNKIMII
jgi:DNA mismatch repair protein MSH4